jgi:hypothetical protein
MTLWNELGGGPGASRRTATGQHRANAPPPGPTSPAGTASPPGSCLYSRGFLL